MGDPAALGHRRRRIGETGIGGQGAGGAAGAGGADIPADLLATM